jgi:hypothetical protein
MAAGAEVAGKAAAVTMAEVAGKVVAMTTAAGEVEAAGKAVTRKNRRCGHAVH